MSYSQLIEIVASYSAPSHLIKMLLELFIRKIDAKLLKAVQAGTKCCQRKHQVMYRKKYNQQKFSLSPYCVLELCN